MQIDRARIVAKIRGLLSKTAENGCTEAEALTALDKARAMMDAYEVTAEDCKLEGEAAAVFASAAPDPHSIRMQLAAAIAEFCDCKVWRTPSTGAISFCGLHADADLAGWLTSSLAEFVDRELTAHLLTSTLQRSLRRRQVNGFVMGACGRISRRLDELTQQSKVQATTNGRALVVAKGALVAAKMAELDLRPRSARRSRRKIDGRSYASGQAAGDRASFGRPVDGPGVSPRLA